MRLAILLLTLALSGCLEAATAEACKKTCAPLMVANVSMNKCECVVPK